MESIIIGLVEGLTEFLPISSTGHLLIAQALLNSPRSDAFNIAIQVGPIIACTLVFRERIFTLLRGWKQKPLRDESIKLMVSFIATAIAGFIAKKFGLELPESVFPVAMAILLGALVIFAVENWYGKKILKQVSPQEGNCNGIDISPSRRQSPIKTGTCVRAETVTWALAFAVAAGQVIAMVFPGASRSGAAIMAALLVGASRPVAVRFAFLVGIPTMIAAASKEIWDATRMGIATDLYAWDSLIAYAVATISAWATVVWLLKYVQTNSFLIFAWYRLALGIILMSLLAAGILQ